MHMYVVCLRWVAFVQAHTGCDSEQGKGKLRPGANEKYKEARHIQLRQMASKNSKQRCITGPTCAQAIGGKGCN